MVQTEIRILIKNLYTFKVFGGKNLIREFFDKGWNVKSLHKLLIKKLWDAGLMRRRMASGRRLCVRFDASLVLQGTVRTYQRRYELGLYTYLLQISRCMFLPKTRRI